MLRDENSTIVNQVAINSVKVYNEIQSYITFFDVEENQTAYATAHETEVTEEIKERYAKRFYTQSELRFAAFKLFKKSYASYKVIKNDACKSSNHHFYMLAKLKLSSAAQKALDASEVKTVAVVTEKSNKKTVAKKSNKKNAKSVEVAISANNVETVELVTVNESNEVSQ